ncbi:MAG: metallophosphoesterase, partial [Bacteroidaceae bacterium]|nr:metallophosphoesterase [Bacteroidaceae bacterium]
WVLMGALWMSLATALGQSWLKAGPYLQEVTDDGATVVFEHGTPSLSWVQVRVKGTTGTTNFYQIEHGQIKAYSQIAAPVASLPVQNFAIRLKGLQPATTYEYRICAKSISRANSDGFTTSGTTPSYTSAWKTFSTQDPQATEHHLFLTSDLHNRPDTLAAQLQLLDYKTCDHFIFNGDMEEGMQFSGTFAQNPYSAYVNKCVEMFASTKPFEVVRGNHETRGNLARHFRDYFPRQSGTIYNLYRWGDLAVLMLDCGEDKADDHEEYFGLADYYAYREQEAEWLNEVLKTDAFKTARWRLLICHVPLVWAAKIDAKTHGEGHLASQVMPILKRQQFDLAISGHTHPDTYTYYPKYVSGVSNPFEDYTIGAHSAARIDIEGNAL